MTFRYLNKNEIQVRVQKNDDNYASLVIYKDARVDINILNEVYGVGLWKKRYEMVGQYLTCIVSVYNKELKEWIDLQDVGVKSNFEPEKGLFSDAFKRACFNLGLGIELYTAPNIFIKLNSNDIKIVKKDGKEVKKIVTLFFIKDYEIKDGVITKLVIVDNHNAVRFTYDNKATESKEVKQDIIDDNILNDYYINRDCLYFKKGEFANKYLHTLSIDDLNKIVKELNAKKEKSSADTQIKIDRFLANINKILLKKMSENT